MSRIVSGSRETDSSPLTAQRNHDFSSHLSDESDEDNESRPEVSNDVTCKPFAAYIATPPRSLKSGLLRMSVDYENSSPQKRSASYLSAEMAEMSRRVNGNPLRNVVRKNLERSVNTRSPSETGDEDASPSSSEAEDSGDEYGASPKKKPKTKAKGSIQSKGKRGKKSSGSTFSSATDAILARAKLESAFDYGEDDMIKKSQEESRARLADMDKRIAFASGSQVSSSSADSVPREAMELITCPFCFEDMPKKMSTRLKETMQYWLDQYHQKRRIGSTATLEACQQHRDEKDTIPEGRLKGFKMRLNPDKLRLRIRSEKLPFVGHMRERILDPESSEWYRSAMKMRKEIGRQADTAIAQMHGMEELQAGYFGELGWETIRDALMELFVEEVADEQCDLERVYTETPLKLGGLRPNKFIELVLVPELILLLIIDDFKGRNNTIMSLEEAREVRNGSTAYGLAQFPSKAMGNVIEGRNVFGDKDIEPKKKAKDKLKDKGGSSSSQKKASRAGSTQERAIDVVGSPKKQRRSQIITPENEYINETPPLTQTSGISSRPRPRPVARASKPSDNIYIDISSQSAPQSSLPFASSQDRLGNGQGDAIILSPDPSYPLYDDDVDDDSVSQSFSSQSLPSQIIQQRSPSLAMTPESRKIRQRTTSGRIDGY